MEQQARLPRARGVLKQPRQEKLRANKRDDLLIYKGAECGMCGLAYNGVNAFLFDFHHTDSSSKKFQLNTANMNRSITKLYIEADKCILLCSNCHRIEHDNLKCNKSTQLSTKVTQTDKIPDKE